MVVVMLARDWSSTETATPELSASRKTPTAVAAPESAAVACDGEATAVASAGEATAVRSPHGGRCRTASQRENEEAGEE
jgi:hypothetical protein